MSQPPFDPYLPPGALASGSARRARSACALCLAAALRDAPSAGATGAALLAAVYLVVSVASALLLWTTGPGAHLSVGSSTMLRGAVSLTMMALGIWGAAIATRLAPGG